MVLVSRPNYASLPSTRLHPIFYWPEWAFFFQGCHFQLFLHVRSVLTTAENVSFDPWKRQGRTQTTEYIV